MANPGLLLEQEDLLRPAQARPNAQLRSFASRRRKDIDTSHIVSKAADSFKYLAAKAGAAFIGCSLCFPAMPGQAAIRTSQHPVELFREPGRFPRYPQWLNHTARPQHFRVRASLADARQPVWEGNRIIIEKGEQRTLSDGYTTVARPGRASLLAIFNGNDAWKLRSHSLQQMRIVIHDDDGLKRGHSLLLNRFDRRHEIIPAFLCIGANDDRYIELY